MHNKNLVAIVRVQSLIVTIINTKQNETERKKNNNALTVLPPLSLWALKENNDGCPEGAYPVRKKTKKTK